jgi:CheY-like chemotaxis protein/HPt (histidine-containing phosphotransfer) domain-containing protein
MQYTVLIVDDDAQWRKLLASLLQVRGYKVLQATSALSAQLLVEQSNPDLAIVDHRVPDFDAITWLTWLRESDSNIPVIVLSSFLCDAKMISTLNDPLGVSVVLQKPVKPIPFVTLIDKVIRKSTLTTDQFDQPQYKDAVDTFLYSIKKTKDSGIFSRSSIVPRIHYPYTTKTSGIAQRADNPDSQPKIEDDFQVDLAELKQEFVQSVAERLAQLQTLVPIAASGSAEALKEIRVESHRMRGSAGAFGMPKLGNLMGDIEDSLAASTEELTGDTCTWRQVNFYIAKAVTILGQEKFEKSKHISTDYSFSR